MKLPLIGAHVTDGETVKYVAHRPCERPPLEPAIIVRVIHSTFHTLCLGRHSSTIACSAETAQCATEPAGCASRRAISASIRWLDMPHDADFAGVGAALKEEPVRQPRGPAAQPPTRFPRRSTCSGGSHPGPLLTAAALARVPALAGGGEEGSPLHHCGAAAARQAWCEPPPLASRNEASRQHSIAYPRRVVAPAPRRPARLRRDPRRRRRH